jgi:uncharacterized protein (TIGR02117 family)
VYRPVTMRWLLRGVAILLVAPPLIYLIAAFGNVLVAPRAPLPVSGIPVYACDNGVHADLVLPVAAAGVDWRAVFRAENFTGPVEGFTHVNLGWGSRDFYLNTPTWADVKVSRAVKSVLWDETVVRADYRPQPIRGENCREWRVDDETYRRLAAHVRDSLRLSQDKPVRAGPGYGDRDAFFVANGEYTIIDTCNQWTGEALRVAGAPVAPWTPFSFLVLWNMPMISS